MECPAEFSTNKNKVVSLLGQDTDGDGKEDDLVASGLFIGESLGTIYDYEVEGIWQLADKENGTIMKGFYPGTYKIKDQNGDGEITAGEDRVILGHKEPAYMMGISNDFSYKGFELRFSSIPFREVRTDIGRRLPNLIILESR